MSTQAEKIAALEAQVQALTGAVTTLVGKLDAIVAPAVAQAAPVTKATEPEHIGPSGKPDGRRFPCTADGGCGRLLRSAKRAAIHGVDAGGHTAAK